MYDIDKCQKVKLDQGFIYLGSSNENQSVGYLELNPQTSLTLHNRPAVEKLTQVKGKSDMIVFKEDKAEIKTLKTDSNTFSILANLHHIHTNPYDEISLTYWDFDGDITQIINTIKKA